MTQEKQPKRKLTGLRIDPVLLARVDAVAERQRSNQRIVIEQCIDAHLPKLELVFGISSPGKGAGCPDTVDSVTADAMRLAGERPERGKGRR